MIVRGQITDTMGVPQNVTVEFIPYQNGQTWPPPASYTSVGPTAVVSSPTTGKFTALIGDGEYYVKIRTYPLIEFFISVPFGITEVDLLSLAIQTPSIATGALGCYGFGGYGGYGGCYIGSCSSNQGVTVVPSPALRMLAASVSLPSGVSTYTVTGLGLPFTPSTVFFTINVPPNGGLTLQPKLVGTPTTDGFVVDLGGTTDSANYVLGYIMV